MWLVVQFYISNMSSPVQFQLHSGHQVLPPRCRWDLCGAKLHQFGRKDPNFRVVGEEWRCRAQVFLLGLWHDFEKAVGSGRWTLGSENLKELKRFPETSMICHQCLRRSVIANWFKCSCLKLFLPVLWIGKRVAAWVHLSSEYVLCFNYTWCKINRLLMCEPWLQIFHNMSRSCYFIVTLMLFSFWQRSACAYLLNQKVWLSLAMVAKLLRTSCGLLCSHSFPPCVVQYSFSSSLDTKFCLHAAGGINVYHNFQHLGGSVEISNSSADSGGAVLRSSSWVFGTILKKL